jgi:DNA polymerase I-like protein with 3'-5' exonuclease and polymerase domains
MSDFLFDIAAIQTSVPSKPHCGKCPLSNVGTKYDQPYKIQEGNQTVLLIGGAVSDYAHMMKVPVTTEFIKPILDLLEGYTVYYIPVAHCAVAKEPISYSNLVHAAECCSYNLYQTIKQLKPDFTVLFGSPAITAIYSNRCDKGCTVEVWRGTVTPDQTLHTNVICTYPLMAPCTGTESGVLWRYIQQDLAQIKTVKQWRDYSDLPSRVKIIADKQVLFYLDRLHDGSVITFDYETTGLKPDNKGHEIVCVSVRTDIDNYAVVFELTDTVLPKWKQVLADETIKKIAHNIKMEDRWTRKRLKTPVKGWIWDTCIGAHCVNPNSASGLKFQALLQFGVDDYSRAVHHYLEAETSNDFNRIHKCDKKQLHVYCGIDSYLEYDLYLYQKDTLCSRRNTLGRGFDYGVEFFTKVARAFSVMEGNGIAIDKALMGVYLPEIEAKRQEAITQFKTTPIYKEWYNIFLHTTDLGSDVQLRHILFDVLGNTPTKFTSKDKETVDEEALTDLGIEGLDSYIRVKKFNKIIGTYYAQINREMDENGLLHCEMQLNAARTFRTSCTKPNLQNISKTDKEYAKYIRDLFIPQNPEWCIVEADLKGCEVAGAACHTQDPNLIAYVSNPKLDMHKDLGEHLYNVDLALISKDLRSITKGYTFGSFYGSYWKLTGPFIWKQLQLQEPKLLDGKPVLTHLSDIGITTVEDFTRLAQETDDFMWNTQFPGYQRWKERQWDSYLQLGFVDLYTGFRRPGPLSRNQAINTPIQGDSGHINLWLCCYILSKLKDTGIRAKLFLQIHDSVVAIVHPDDIAAYRQLYIDGVARLREIWKWIIVPIEIEFEVSPPGKSWFEKKEYKG